MKDYSNYHTPYKDIMLENGRLMFDLQLRDFEGKDIKIGENTETRGLVRYHQNPLNEFKQDRKLTVWHEENIHTGNYITTVDDNRVFLIVSQINTTEIVKSCLMRECNHDLKWIDKETGELIIRPCIEDTRTLYTTGIKEEEVMEIPNGMVGIMLPYGDISRRLDRNDRFVFNKTSYRVTFYDETTFPGMVTLICQETGLSHLDDKVNEIADRWVEINGEIVDRLPWLDNQEPGKPPIVDPEEQPEEGVYYTIKVKKQYQTDTEYVVSSHGWQAYTIKKFINNAEIEGNFTFELSKSVQNLTLTKETDNSCKLSSGSLMGKFSVNLTVTDVDKNEVVVEQEIKINGR